MKTFGLEQTNLDSCVRTAQKDRVIITRQGKPVALVVGVEGMDEEQLLLGSSRKFWELIEERRKDKTLTRPELEKKLESRTQSTKKRKIIKRIRSLRST